MTVIAGLETTVGEKAVVLASDRLQILPASTWVQCLGLIEKSPDFDLTPYFKMLEEQNRDRCILTSSRKIEISPDNQRALAHTGIDNQSNRQISELLLETDRFLKNTPFLTTLFFPLGFPKEEQLLEAYLKLYKSSFNLDRSLSEEHIPEIRRIFDIHTAGLNVREFPLLGVVANWDRNYNPVLSEYLFVKYFRGKPCLFEITATGAVVPRQYYAKGSGGNYALFHLRDRLGTHDASFFCQRESGIEREIDLEEAKSIVREAIEYACYHAHSCSGFEYVILRKSGVEPHFSEEEFSYEINIPEMIDERIKRLTGEVKQLKRIKAKYLGRTP